jgi:hypothetical protein
VEELIMRKVTFSLGIGFANAIREETFTLDELGISENDFETEEELDNLLEQEWKIWMNEYIDGGWEVE